MSTNGTKRVSVSPSKFEVNKNFLALNNFWQYDITRAGMGIWAHKTESHEQQSGQGSEANSPILKKRRALEYLINVSCQDAGVASLLGTEPPSRQRSLIHNWAREDILVLELTSPSLSPTDWVSPVFIQQLDKITLTLVQLRANRVLTATLLTWLNWKNDLSHKVDWRTASSYYQPLNYI